MTWKKNIATNMVYKGYMRHQNLEKDKEICEAFYEKYRTRYFFPTWTVYENTYEFVTSVVVAKEDIEEMASLFGAIIVKGDNEFTHIQIEATKEWPNPLLINDILFGLFMTTFWLPSGIVTLYNLYFFVFS